MGLARLWILPQMTIAAEAVGVDLVDILGARGPRREPAAVGNHLDPAEALAVAGCGDEGGEDRLAGELGGAEAIGRQLLQQGLLLRRRRRIDPCVERHRARTSARRVDVSRRPPSPRGALPPAGRA